MASFFVNGSAVSVEENQSLLRYLRDELHITSCKDGCSEGACGTCTVLLDGKTVRACTVKTQALAGKSVLTVEGLSAFEKEVYTWAFGEAGAVQCGFCIPGMVLCAKGLLDWNLEPTPEQIRYAIRNNICRCTGYVKIVEAILLAAKALREGFVPAPSTENWQIGSSVARLDVEQKVLGSGQYPDDVYLDGMCYGSALRAKYPRARVLSIDTSAAKALDGVVCVLTAADIPGKNYIGHLEKDQPTMIPVGELTHYLGDAIALVCAKDMKTVEAAKKLIKVEYAVLPFVSSPEQAAQPDAPLVFETAKDNVQAHKHVSRGDASGAIARSAQVLSQHFTTPWTEHAFLETECCVAYPLENGGVRLLTTDQSTHTTRRECAAMLGIPPEQCEVQNLLVGGGFGGKEDMSVQHHAALLAYLAHVPVKVRLTRAESILVHPKRHAFDMDFTIGCDKNGIIQGVKAKVVADSGAFASLGGPVLERACTHAAGPYAYENFEIEGISYYTNNPPSGAFRGFGVTQTCFAIETLLNMMAEKLNISPWEIRHRNAIRPGGVLPNGQIVDASTGLVETLEAVKPQFDAAIRAGEPVGLACAMKNAGVGVGIPDWGRVKLIVENDGLLHFYSGASCIGQGLGTVMLQIICTETGLKREQLVYERSNTWLAPDSGDTSGSRQTCVTGEACRRACQKLKTALAGKQLADLKGQEFYADFLAKTDPLGANVPNPVSHVAYGYATQVCILDKQSKKVKTIVAAHDVGKAINPLSCEGQIEGGVTMSMGYALTEQYPLENCKPKAKYGSLGLLRAPDAPHVNAIVVEKPGLPIAHGAIGIGEITAIPTAPAIAQAYYQATGIRETSLPLKNTPYARKAPEPVTLKAPGKRLVAVAAEKCIGCGECVRACASVYRKTDDADSACLRIVTAKRGYGFAPTVCTQCGMCALACPTDAITRNPKGVYMINKNLCIGCGLCAAACPNGVIVRTPQLPISSKCIACGICVKQCPMDVLAIAEG